MVHSCFYPADPSRFGHTFSAERDLFVCLHNGHLFICFGGANNFHPRHLETCTFGTLRGGIYWQIVAANASKVRLLYFTSGSFQFTLICIFAGESRAKQASSIKYVTQNFVQLFGQFEYFQFHSINHTVDGLAGSILLWLKWSPTPLVNLSGLNSTQHHESSFAR